jgi:hypothetical protein
MGHLVSDDEIAAARIVIDKAMGPSPQSPIPNPFVVF